VFKGMSAARPSPCSEKGEAVGTPTAHRNRYETKNAGAVLHDAPVYRERNQLHAFTFIFSQEQHLAVQAVSRSLPLKTGALLIN
jgi:hypothetical protein